MSPTVSRRAVLQGGSAAAALAALGTALPPSVQAAMARPAPRGGLKAVEHVVILMQENRSFDHYYGTLPGVLGYGDRRPLRLRTGQDVFHQPRPGKDPVLPFSLRKLAVEQGRPVSDVQRFGSTPHRYGDATAAANFGWWDAWVPNKTEMTMAYLEPADLPVQVALARAFTLCDASFCSMHGGTNPNRNYMWTGTTAFEPGKPGERAVLNTGNDYDHPGYEWTTYPERLEAAGVSWQIYQEWDNYGDNSVEYFVPFKKVGAKVLAHVTPPAGVEKFWTTEHVYDTIAKLTDAGEKARLLAEMEKGRASLTPAERSLFDRAMYRSETGTIVERFAADIKKGALPTVSWLVPPSIDSEHPGGPSDPMRGGAITAKFLDAIASDPDTWDHTVFILLFDENDGLFDHVPSPTPPREYTEEWYEGRPMGLGPRTPMTIISPWSVGGKVSSEVVDITSTLMFLEKVTGVKEPNISRFRRQICGDLTSTLDFSGRGRRVQIPAAPEVALPSKDRWKPSAPEKQSMPVQQAGRRPATPVPYVMGASGRVVRGELRLAGFNTGTLAAPVSIYSYLGDLAEPIHRVVKGSDKGTIPLTRGAYDVALRGPDRFVVDMAGTAAGAAAGLDMSVVQRRGRRDADVVLSNHGRRPVTVTLTDESYGGRSVRVRVRAGEVRRMPWILSDGWYDVSATVREDATYQRRFTGRLAGRRDRFVTA